MDAHKISAFLEELAREFSVSLVAPDPSPAINNLGYKVDQITGHLQVIADVMSKLGANMLESAAFITLQKENSSLTAENSSLRRRQNQMAQVVKDLGSPCVGCKKAPWQLHATGCDWSSNVIETLDRLASGE